MRILITNIIFYFVVNISLCSVSNGQAQYPDDGNFDDTLIENQYFRQGSEPKSSIIQKSLAKLKNSPTLIEGWPLTKLRFGQVAAVAVDKKDNVYVFHRGSNAWDQRSFSNNNVYNMQYESPIPEPTIVVLNSSGYVKEMWGQDMFYLPHGLTVDSDDNVWLTDVALHQVFRFSPNDKTKPNLVLGTRFIPGTDHHHFCKPSAVAVCKNGDFFVADGYCNNRIIKYDTNGVELTHWGQPNVISRSKQPPYAFYVPHGLALAEDIGTLFVADRENGRLQSFHVSNGTFISNYAHYLFGERLFGVAYSPKGDGLLYVVNGPVADGSVAVRGFVINLKTGKLLRQFGENLRTPHDVAVSNDGAYVYVAELAPPRVTKYAEEVTVTDNPAKPTAVVDGVSVEASPISTNSLGAGGAAALGAALLVLAAALLVARSTRIGKRGVRRQQRWEYGGAEFKLQRLLGRSRTFSRVATDDSDDDNTALTEGATTTAKA